MALADKVVLKKMIGTFSDKKRMLMSPLDAELPP